MGRGADSSQGSWAPGMATAGIMMVTSFLLASIDTRSSSWHVEVGSWIGGG